MRNFLLYLAVISCLILSHGQNAFCEDSVDDDDGDVDSPTFSTPAQAAHAANLAEAAAAESNEATDAAQQAVSDCQQALADAEASEDQKAIDAATAALADAEDAYAEAIAELAGVLTSDIAEMRANDMGWGQIAHELGVSPGLLGLGHTYRHRNRISGDTDMIDGDAEIAEATTRDPKTGWAKGHGLGTGKDSSVDRGVGLARGAQTKGNSGNVKGGGSSERDSGGAPGNSGGSKGNGGASKDKGGSEKSNNGKGNTK